MKNFNSTTKGYWVEIVNVPLTQEQKTLMQSTDPADADAKGALRQTIKAAREIEVVDNIALVSFYATKKPVLEATDTYQLISIDITEKANNAYSGIMNYRLNGEHKQLRF